MKKISCGIHSIALINILLFYITIAHGQYICNNTYGWNNSAGHPCLDYGFNSTSWRWCSNGTYTPSTMWTGGNTFKYPEFNCCVCGKGWPLWYVPASGNTAVKAVPEQTSNNSVSNNLICHDKYRNATACTMKCKKLAENSSIISLSTITSQDFNQLNCTLYLNIENNTSQYILEIPVDNYLIYFANWTTDDYNLSCNDNATVITSNMLCRYEVDDEPFELPVCPSQTITSRYIRPDCVDAENWTSTAGYSCFEYEMVQGRCANKRFRSSGQTASLFYSYPDRHCCACGKGLLSPIKSISTINNSINSSEIGIIHLKNCSGLTNFNHTFNMKCLGPLNFINTNITMNATLYNCPLDCFFNWNTTQIKPTQTFNISRQLYGTAIVYNLISNFFARDKVVCGSFIDEKQTSIDSTFITHDPSTFKLPITTERPGPWHPLNCTNGKIGPYCNISTDSCLMTQPCLNNGTCLTINSSFICSCLPSKFSGINCEIDIRPCKSYTCLSHGICIETSPTSFICQCELGYEGINCQSLTDYCQGIKCENNGQCRPSRLNFTCECTTKDYTGRYCEIKSSSLATKQTVKRSLGYIAIIAIILVAGVIVSMDVLKYIFKIDTVAKERRKRLAAKKQTKTKHRPVIVRFIYVDKPKPETIIPK